MLPGFKASAPTPVLHCPSFLFIILEYSDMHEGCSISFNPIDCTKYNILNELPLTMHQKMLKQ